MNMVYELKHKKRAIYIDILMIIGFIVGLFIFTFLMYLIQELIRFPYMFYVEFIVIIAFAIYFAKTKLIEFTYYLNGDILRIDRIYSKRPKLDLFIRLENIAYMGKLKDLPEPYLKHKKQKETFMILKDNSFCIVHLVETKYFNAILSPSDEFEENLIKAWKECKYRPKKKKK